MDHFYIWKNYNCKVIDINQISANDVLEQFYDYKSMIYVMKEEKLLGVIGATELARCEEDNEIIYNNNFTYFEEKTCNEETIRNCFKLHLNWSGIPVIDAEGKLLYEYKCSQRQFYDDLTIPESEGLNHEKREEKIIVSLTSHGCRLQSVYLTIKSIMYQTVKADEIVLYIDDENEEEIKKEEYLISHGIRIVRDVPNLKCYTKFYYAMQDFQNAVIITVDDDFYYADDLIESLYTAHFAHPEAVICRGGARLSYEKGKVLPYMEWEDDYKSSAPSCQICVKGYSGILYPIGVYRKELLNKELFSRLSAYNDDLWITACLQELQVPVFSIGKSMTSLVEDTQRIALWNPAETPRRNDMYIANLRNHFTKAFKSDKQEIDYGE